MNIQEQISNYISSQIPQKSKYLEALHEIILAENPQAELWFLDGKNEEGKTVSNPNVGYGRLKINYKDGSSRDFYQIGISTNTNGISIYIGKSICEGRAKLDEKFNFDRTKQIAFSDY